MASVLNMTPVPGAPNTYGWTPDDPVLAALLTGPGHSPYTPELTEGALGLLRRRTGERTGANVAAVQSNFMKRGGTGSSLEALTMKETRTAGDQLGEDEALQFLLGVADRAADERRFRIGLYQDDVNRKHEEMLADRYMAQLARQNSEERKRRRRLGVAQGITTLAGAGIGAGYGGLEGAKVGASIGNSLPFLFS